MAWKLMHEYQHSHSFVNKISPLLRLCQSYTAEMNEISPPTFVDTQEVKPLSIWTYMENCNEDIVQHENLYLTDWLAH
jgi:hypothetical protein